MTKYKEKFAAGRANPFIKGTFILTLTGIVSRIIGFFYRIYLSRLFGEEGMGIYQLTGPVLALTFSVTAAGMQTAISKYVASAAVDARERSAFRVLANGLFVSLPLSLLCTGIILCFSETIAARFLLEPRTASLLRILALSIPLSTVHSCVNGYYYGIKKTALPSAAQLLEQFFRVLCVFLADRHAASLGGVPTLNAAVAGLVIGEFAATAVCVLAAWRRFRKTSGARRVTDPPDGSIPKLLALAAPLSLTRIVINLLQSVEAVHIPTRLVMYGYDTATALSVYGVMTGMALPLILFPNALTGAMSLLLLPMISEADASGNRSFVRRTADKTVLFCLLLGGVCTAGFLLFGGLIGNFLYHSELAGRFIRTLSFICPSLYLGTTLSSILHGLGKAMSVFWVNVSSLLIRLCFVFFLLPNYGINGYAAGMIISQTFAALCLFLLLRREG